VEPLGEEQLRPPVLAAESGGASAIELPLHRQAGPASRKASGIRVGALSLRRPWLVLLAIWGPGLVVMLADTDAGSLVTASQSGARWGYAMVLPQLLLIPVLYIVQEMTVRLGIYTRKGHGALIREQFGRGWAFLSAGTLFLSATGALVTEFAGIAGVGELFGLSRSFTVPVAAGLLIAVAMIGRYRRVERTGILFGLGELALLPALVLAHPHAPSVLHGLTSVPVGHRSYMLLLAANVGAVIMPWMVFYQQGAVIDKGLTGRALRSERQDTAVGAVLTQIVMIAMVVLLAATVARGADPPKLETVGQIAAAVHPLIGATSSRVLIGLAVLGAALVAALVASLAASWGLSEALGWAHTLNRRPSWQTAKFYATYTSAHLIGAILVLTSIDLVGLTIDVEVMNALLLPIVLGFLLALEARALVSDQRMRGVRRVLVTGLCLAVMGFGLYIVPALLGAG
jgi:Mn2+/Fe2+ NRAMP family transporter